ncbi:MAG: site-specific DNA-methyltransferase [Spirochaetes bacterium]|nr:site-specific DNA-methyltransferase [Spirochaetota bacterium]
MDKMKFETPNLSAENVAKIASLFPGVVAEGKVNFDLLRTMLGDEIFTDEAYEFTWVGKREAIAEAGRPIRKTLRPCPSESKNWDNTENLYIEGDNLDVLKLLQESYLGKVKMIYIDPPYNTGSDFVYRDNFTVNREDYEEEAGVYDEDGERLFRNTQSNGRFHSDWCSMIYPRLVLARNVLRNDGLVFISINDIELYNLKKICDEIFGIDNHVSTFVWKNKYGPGAFTRGVASLHEYILCYGKNFPERIDTDLSEEEQRKYNLRDNKYASRSGYITQPLATLSKDDRPNLVYPLIHNGVEIWPNKQWIWSKERLYKAYNNDEVVINEKNGKFSVRFKQYLRDDLGRIRKGTPLSLVTSVFNQDGTKEMENLIGRGIFEFPKPHELIKRFLSFIINENEERDDIIFDFFSGSATTAHAVMQLNAEDGGKRKFIMVQLPEVCAEGTEAAKAGYANICEIGKERIRRAGEKIKEEIKAANAQLKLGEDPKQVPDIGFRVLKVDDSNMNDVYYAAGDYTQDMLAMTESNIKADRTDLDLLFGCLLDWGLPLSMPHSQETIDGFTVHTYNGGDLVACFEENVSEKAIREIAARKPLRAVFRDSSFTSSPEKINVFEIFKLLAPNTTVRVI